MSLRLWNQLFVWGTGFGLGAVGFDGRIEGGRGGEYAGREADCDICPETSIFSPEAGVFWAGVNVWGVLGIAGLNGSVPFSFWRSDAGRLLDVWESPDFASLVLSFGGRWQSVVVAVVMTRISGDILTVMLTKVVEEVTGLLVATLGELLVPWFA
jgi:hypothetical protein